VYQPTLGPCSCKPGTRRDNCPTCEGTGRRVDFAAIRAQTTDNSRICTEEHRLCEVNGAACPSVSPNGRFRCTREAGHPDPHIACGHNIGHNYAAWLSKRNSRP